MVITINNNALKAVTIIINQLITLQQLFVFICLYTNSIIKKIINNHA